MNALEFCNAIGLTAGTERWIRENEGVPLREEIIAAWMDTLASDCPTNKISNLRRLIARITHI